MLMADVVDKNSNNSSSSPNKKSKKWLLIIGFILTLITVSSVLGWRYYVNSNQIKLGGEIINKKIVDSYSKEISTYYKNNSLNLTESSRKKAIDDLLMHAALKEKAKKYNISISQSDFDLEMAPVYDTYGGKSQFNKFSKPEGVKNFIINNSENEIYKKKLKSKVISHKKLLIVSITVDTKFFNKLDETERLQKIQEAKQQIQKDYYPLFQKATPAKNIISKANTKIGYDYPEGYDFRAEWVGMVTKAYYFTCADTIENCFNDLPNYNLANAVKTSSKIKTLTKKGQSTDVFMSKAGFVGIIRLEDQYGENYTSWNDFLYQFNKKYSKQLKKMY